MLYPEGLFLLTRENYAPASGTPAQRLPDGVGGVGLPFGQQVGVGVEGDLDAGVPEPYWLAVYEVYTS